jgi:molybdate transport system ATP-binding protein
MFLYHGLRILNILAILPYHSMINLRHISVHKSGERLLHDFSWRIEKGENIVIRGNSGSGKTTLLETIAGNIPITSGEIQYDFITGESWEERYHQRKQAIHYISTDAALTKIHQHDLFYQQRYYSFGDEFVPLVKDFLGEEALRQIVKMNFPTSLSIESLVQLKLTMLSNGQQKRVMILKNLAQQIPKVLLLDYPFEALDQQSRKDLIRFLDAISINHGVQLIITDHDSDLPSVMNHELVLEKFQIQSQQKLTARTVATFTTPKSKNDLPQPYNPIVEMRKLTIQYGNKVIIKDLNWIINKGERWALIGKNGSGKTTLFSLIYADHPLAYSQKVFLFGKRRGSGESIWDIKNRIFYLGPEQMSFLDPKEKLTSGRAYILKNTSHLASERVIDLINYFEADDFIDRPLRQLSSAQVQLVFIIKCLLAQKELLLLDEPFRFLDPLQKEKVNKYIQLHLDKETTLVLITHMEEDVKRWGQQVLSL